MTQDRDEAPGAALDPAGAEPVAGGGAPRDHLANERTYLAWLRSGVALLGLGFVVARVRIELGELSANPSPEGWLSASTIGLAFAVLGLLTILFATWRYYAVREMIERQRFVPLGAGILMLSLGALLIAIVVILYLLQHVGSPR